MRLIVGKRAPHVHGSETARTSRVLADEPRHGESTSLAVSLALLRCYAPDRSVLGIGDLSEMLGARRETTRECVQRLVELGFLERRASCGYGLGREAHSLGRAAICCAGFGELVWPWLSWLRSRTGLIASLALLDGEEVVYVAWLPSRHPGQAGRAAALRVGWRAPALGTAAGKALLAFVTSLGWASKTCATASESRRLDGEFDEICERRVAVCGGSDSETRCGVAAPILGVCDPIAAIEVTAFAHDGDLRSWASVVRHAAEEIADQLVAESLAA